MSEILLQHKQYSSFNSLPSIYKSDIINILKLHSYQSQQTCIDDIKKYLLDNKLTTQDKANSLATTIVKEQNAILTDRNTAILAGTMTAATSALFTGFTGSDTPLAYKAIEEISGYDPQLPELKLTHVEGFDVSLPVNVIPCILGIIIGKLVQHYKTSKRLQNQLENLSKD